MLVACYQQVLSGSSAEQCRGLLLPPISSVSSLQFAPFVHGTHYFGAIGTSSLYALFPIPSRISLTCDCCTGDRCPLQAPPEYHVLQGLILSDV